jgi:hypothetical protein
MRIVIITIIIVVISIVAIFAFYYFVSSSKKVAYIESVSGVVFPEGTTNVNIYDSGDFYLTGHVSIPKESVADFVKRYDFVSGKPLQPHFGLALLKTQYQTVPASATHILEGKSATNSWVFQLDPVSGDIWVTLLYADHSGDGQNNQ